jgi:ATP-dependent Clp protease ATP-binding subunit ClpX
MFELPGMTGIEEVVINSEVVEGRAKPLHVHGERTPAAQVGTSA